MSDNFVALLRRAIDGIVFQQGWTKTQAKQKLGEAVGKSGRHYTEYLLKGNLPKDYKMELTIADFVIRFGVPADARSWVYQFFQSLDHDPDTIKVFMDSLFAEDDVNPINPNDLSGDPAFDLLSTDLHRVENFSHGKVNKISLSELTLHGSILWGFNPVSPLHFAYDKVFFLLKIVKQLTNSKVRLLAADVHSGLSHKLDNEQTNLRALYYSFYLKSIWGIKHELMRASTYIFAEDAQYLKKLFTLLAYLDVSSLKSTWPVAIKSSEPDARLLYAYIYPVMQVLDIFFLRPSIVFAEESQRKTYELLPMVSKVLGDDISVDFVYIKQSVDIRRKPLIGSRAKDRISLHERRDTLDTKLRHTFSSTDLIDNPVLDLLEFSILPFDNARNILSGYLNSPILTRNSVRQAVQDEVLMLPDAHNILLDALSERVQTIESAYLTDAPTLLSWIDFEQVRKL